MKFGGETLASYILWRRMASYRSRRTGRLGRPRSPAGGDPPASEPCPPACRVGHPPGRQQHQPGPACSFSTPPAPRRCPVKPFGQQCVDEAAVGLGQAAEQLGKVCGGIASLAADGVGKVAGSRPKAPTRPPSVVAARPRRTARLGAHRAHRPLRLDTTHPPDGLRPLGFVPETFTLRAA